MLILKLNKVEVGSRPSYRDGDDEGDNHAIERTRVVLINADTIRNFQPRRDGKVGSRLTFIDGGGYAVSETPQQIIDLIGPDAVRAVEVAPVQIATAGNA